MKITDEVIAEAYEELFADRPNLPERPSVTDEVVEAAYDELFEGRDPYGPDGPFSYEGHRRRIREALEDRTRSKRLTEQDIERACQRLLE